MGSLEKQLAPDGQSPIVTVIRSWKIAFRESIALEIFTEGNISRHVMDVGKFDVLFVLVCECNRDEIRLPETLT